MLSLRRFLVLQSFLAWQGGFFFYATFVVPIGTEILESASFQGAITQRVTHWLNGLGILSLILMAWDQSCTCVLQKTRWLNWSVMLFSLVIQLVLHPVLDRLFHPDNFTYEDKEAFKFWHGVYLWTSAVQWFAGLLAMWLMIRAWHNESAVAK